MTLPNWNYEDYHVEFPDENTSESASLEVLGFRKKLYGVFIYLLRDILTHYEKAAKDGYELGALFVTLATVDYLAGFYVGDETSGKDYINFMKRYYPQKYQPYLNAIYGQLRNGLMHNLVSLSPWKGKNQIDFIIMGKSQSHLEEIRGQISFSIPVFIEDTRRAFWMYRYDLIMKPDENKELVINFENRFNRLGGKAAFMVPMPE